MITEALEPSTNLNAACERLLDDVAAWVHDCMDRYADAPATDVHDQGTFTTGWEPYLRLRDDRAALAPAESYRQLAATSAGTWPDTDQSYAGSIRPVSVTVTPHPRSRRADNDHERIDGR